MLTVSDNKGVKQNQFGGIGLAGRRIQRCCWEFITDGERESNSLSIKRDRKGLILTPAKGERVLSPHLLTSWCRA